MHRISEPKIYRTDEWGAAPPRLGLTNCAAPSRIIFHHTAGHHPEIALPASESLEECFRYAREIQRFHMHDRGWLDSGHNFLVCRNGAILVGRHRSYTRAVHGESVVSAHCPGQNEQYGVEHEHDGSEPFTQIQLAASAHLHAWLIDRAGIAGPGAIYPHHHFFATDCPGALNAQLDELRHHVDRLFGRS